MLLLVVVLAVLYCSEAKICYSVLNRKIKCRGPQIYSDIKKPVSMADHGAPKAPQKRGKPNTEKKCRVDETNQLICN